MPYGSLIIKFAANLAELQSDVRRASTLIGRELGGAVKGAQRALATLGVAGGGVGMVLLAKQAVDVQDQLFKMSQKVGASVEALSGLRYAAALSDVALEDVGTSFAKLAKNMSDARAGTGEAKDAFRALGIDVKTASGELRGTDDVFGDIAEKFAAMEDGAGKTALAIKIFGRSGANLIPLLNQGRDGLKSMSDEARKFGVLVGTEAARAAEEFNDNLTRLGFAFEGAKIGIVNSYLPAMNDWIVANLEAIKIAGSFGEALRLFVFNFEAFTTEKPVEQIERLTKALKDYDEAGPVGKFMQSPTGALFGGRQEDIKKQIEFLKVLQTQQEKANLKGSEFEGFDEALARAARGGIQKVKAPEIVDETAAKKAAEAMRKFAEVAGQLAASRAKTLAAEEQDLAEERLRILEQFHKEGLVEDARYWQTRLEIQQGAMRAQIAAADQEVANAQRAVSLAEKTRGATVEGATDYLTALQKLEEAQAKRNDLEQKFSRLGTENYMESRNAAREYGDAVANLNAQLLELQGRSAEAAAIRFDQQTRQITRQAVNDPAAQETIEKLRAATLAQSEFNDAQKKADLLTRGLALQEERIRNSRETGAISEIRSLQATGDARKAALGDLQRIGAEMESIAQKSGNAFLVQQAAEFRVEIERLATQTDLLAQKFDQIGETAFSDFLTDVIDQTKSVKDAFRSMVDSIVKQINRLASQEIATAIFGGVGGKGGGSGFGSFMANIFSGKGVGGGLGGLFGAGGGGGFGTGAAFGNLDFGMFLAGGGRATGGQPYVVGEQGPELFVPDTSGMVIPNGGGWGGGTTVVNQFTISGNVDARSQQQIAAAAAKGANRALRRNG